MLRVGAGTEQQDRPLVDSVTALSRPEPTNLGAVLELLDLRQADALPNNYYT